MAKSASRRAKSVSKQEKRRGIKVTAEDRISSLPDSILYYILSFLPTKEVVATSFLSKRWKSVWLSMTTFDFDYATFNSSEHLFRFVDAVLFMADSKPVEKFRLRYDSFNCWLDIEKDDRINIWINALIHRKVEHLELFSMGFFMELTPRIFNCDTIGVLKLDRFIVNTFHSINLPSLKVMHLVEAKFPDFESFPNLLSRCPLLQELVLDLVTYFDIHIDEYPKLDILKLEHLVSATVPFSLIRWKALTNVTFLGLNTKTSPDDGHDFPRFENLTRIKFSCLCDEDLSCIVEGLRNCPKLEILEIDQIFVRPDGQGRSMEPILDVPQCVSSKLKEFRLGRYKGFKCQFEFVKFITKNARVLRTISIICSLYHPLEKKYRMIQRLSSCPRGSENCQLFFR